MNMTSMTLNKQLKANLLDMGVSHCLINTYLILQSPYMGIYDEDRANLETFKRDVEEWQKRGKRPL